MSKKDKAKNDTLEPPKPTFYHGFKNSIFLLSIFLFTNKKTTKNKGEGSKTIVGDAKARNDELKLKNEYRKSVGSAKQLKKEDDNKFTVAGEDIVVVNRRCQKKIV